MYWVLYAVAVALALSAGAEQNKTSVGPLRLGVDKEAPVPLRLKYVEPKYPRSASAAQKEGTVTLDLTLDAAGRVAAVKIIKGDSPFNEAAVAAARQWKYQRTVLNGRRTAVVFEVEVEFRLPKTPS